MNQRRRGLGRGLGALIPTGPDRERPVDVFFPAAPTPSKDAAGAAGEATGEGAVGVLTAPAETATGPSASTAATDTSTASDAASTAERGADDPAAIPQLDGAAAATGGAEADPLSPGDGEQAAVTTAVSESPATGATDAVPAASSDDAGLVPVPGARFAELPVGAIRPNAHQPRTVFDESDLDELVASITEIGVLQPIVVRPDTVTPGRYELIMGERRWRATQAAGLETIPAIIRDTDDSDMLRDALLENLHRAALNPLEEAAAYRQLLDDFGCTHEELATRIARSRPQISNTLRLLRLPPLVQRRVAAGVLSAGHARALLGLTDGAEIERLAQRIVSEGLSVRATEEIVALSGDDAPRRQPRVPRAGQRSAAIDELATRLSDRFETRVKVALGKNKGRLTVEFASVEDLNRILDLMAPQDPGILRP